MQCLPHKPKVFISHSTKTGDPLAVCFLDRLYQTLKQARNNDGTEAFEVLLDKTNILTGEKWSEVIREWVLSCDAAIVLLSEAAARSDYVKQEVTLLQQRRQFHPNHLMLLPVCFPQVTEAYLKKRMGPQQITERQMLRLTETNEAQVLEELLLFLNLLPQRIPQHKIEEHLFSFFCFSFADEELKRISDALAIGPLLAGAQIDRAQMIVRALLRAETEPSVFRFRRLRTMLDGMRIKKLDQCQRSLLLDFVFPFCWVNAEAASKLPDIAARVPRTRAVAWAREWGLSERMYLLRGYCHPRACAVYVSNLDGGGRKPIGSHDSFLEHIVSCLYHAFFHRPPKGRYEDAREKLRKVIEDREQEGEPVFLIIPLDAVDKDRAEMILDEFPNVTLFFHSETLTQTGFADLELPCADFLAPPLDLETERDAYVEYGRLLKLIGEPLDRLDNP
ncbi:MAG TPA: toll/interleukin-1 receptor domain-containing protein [Blastocatellia bacterium]|nr:toll/interleukin-1 receptor domain-containing protein [Blastocatellia bacterium]